jgi:hypothetical protein
MQYLFPILLFQLICQCHQSLNPDSVKRFTIQLRSPLNDTEAMAQDRDRFLSHLAAHNIMHNIRIRYNYSDVMNGMYIEVVQPELSAAASRSGIKSSQMAALNFLDYTLSTCPYVHQYWPGKNMQDQVP